MEFRRISHRSPHSSDDTRSFLALSPSAGTETLRLSRLTKSLPPVSLLNPLAPTQIHLIPALPASASLVAVDIEPAVLPDRRHCLDEDIALWIEAFTEEGFVATRSNARRTTILNADTLAQFSFIHRQWLLLPHCCPYLLESASGKLLLVLWTHRDAFEEYELDDCAAPGWLRVGSIGDCMLFVDEDHALSLRATGFGGFRGNSIYFVRHDAMYICNIDDGAVQEFLRFGEDARRTWHTSYAWVTPTLC